MANDNGGLKPMPKPKGTVLSGPKPLHFNLKMGGDVLKDPFGTGKGVPKSGKVT